MTRVLLQVPGHDATDITAALKAQHRKGKPPMMPDPEFDQAADNAYAVTAAELRSFIERIEADEARKAEIAGEIKETYAEAKGRGYDTKAIRTLIAQRRRKPDEVAEEEAVLAMYRVALGMD